jgi:hypothetical protein
MVCLVFSRCLGEQDELMQTAVFCGLLKQIKFVNVAFTLSLCAVAQNLFLKTLMS